jgi:hypothetical protein
VIESGLESESRAKEGDYAHTDRKRRSKNGTYFTLMSDKEKEKESERVLRKQTHQTMGKIIFKSTFCIHNIHHNFADIMLAMMRWPARQDPNWLLTKLLRMP